MRDANPNLGKHSDSDLHKIRRNAQTILDAKKIDPDRQLKAELMMVAVDAELERRHLPGMIKSFYDVYPGGFYGEKQAEEERNYKVRASNACRDLLSAAACSDLIDEANWIELSARVQTLVNMTNLIQGSFEKPKLLDALKVPDNARAFHLALADCLHGEGSPAERIGRFASVLEDLQLNKWTYATYFIFLHDREHCMFVKPTMLQISLEKSQYPLVYESKPSARMYQQVLEFSAWLMSKISELNPRDMIDVHSFMWHMAPTGKWAEDES